MLENKSGNISETRKDRRSYCGRPIETHQRSFERYDSRPRMASPSPKFGVRNPHSKLQSKISGKRVLIEE